MRVCIHFHLFNKPLWSFYLGPGTVLELGLQLGAKSGWPLHEGAYILTERGR